MIDKHTTLIDFLHMKGISHAILNRLTECFNRFECFFVDFVSMDHMHKIANESEIAYGDAAFSFGKMPVLFTNISDFANAFSLGKCIEIEKIVDALVHGIDEQLWVKDVSWALSPRDIIDLHDFSFESAAIEVDLNRVN